MTGAVVGAESTGLVFFFCVPGREEDLVVVMVLLSCVSVGFCYADWG